MNASQAELEMALVEARAGLTLEASAVVLALAEAYMREHGPQLNAPRLTPRPVVVPQVATGLFIRSLLGSPIEGED